MARIGLRPIDELIRLAMIGDGTAFTELWDTHIGSLRTFLKGWLRNFDDFYIDDICSRSFEKAFRQISSYDPSKSQFGTWLRIISKNTALDTLEHESRTQKKYVSLDDGSAEIPMYENLRDEVDTPLESIIKDEDEEKLQHCIESLPDLYREVARCRLIEGMQYKEIADELGMQLNTVRTRIRRAKAIIDKVKEENE